MVLLFYHIINISIPIKILFNSKIFAIFVIMKLFLDDNRKPYDVFKLTINPVYENNNWDIVKTYEDFTSYIEKNGIPEMISFDHDLSFDHYYDENQKGELNYDEFKEKTGYHCAQWLIEYCKKNSLNLPTWFIHSANPVGSQNIKKLLTDFN
jgi:hypothetical protein